MKSVCTSKLLDLIIKKSVHGLDRADEQFMEELIAASADPAAVRYEIQQIERSLEALSVGVRQSAAGGNVADMGEMPQDLKSAIIKDGKAFIARKYGSRRKSDPREDAVALESLLSSGSSDRSMAGDDLENLVTPAFCPRGVPTGKNKSVAVAKRVGKRAARRASDLGSAWVRKPATRAFYTWFLAAASLLLLVLFIRQQPATSTLTQQESLDEPIAPPSIALVDELVPLTQQMKEFKSSATDLVRLAWQPVDIENVSGEVLWSDLRQEGFMTFSGLPINDPDQFRYQIWIFDTDISQKFPIDGGVFDVVQQDNWVVPILAHLQVKKAVQFLVTQERPSGVVVSTRSMVPVLARLE